MPGLTLRFKDSLYAIQFDTERVDFTDFIDIFKVIVTSIAHILADFA